MCYRELRVASPGISSQVTLVELLAGEIADFNSYTTWSLECIFLTAPTKAKHLINPLTKQRESISQIEF